MALTLRWLGSTRLNVDGRGLRADLLARPAAEVARDPVAVGNALGHLGDLFRVDGDGSDGRVVFEGDLRSVRDLGSNMEGGRLEVRGDAGAGLGSALAGGSIEVFGSTGAWLGAEMAGGTIRVRGDSGDFAGAALPGSRVGVRGGSILVDGRVGDDAGLAMRRGLIAVGGAAGDGLGRGMVAGSIFGFGPIGRHPGAGMKRGTLALFGLDDPDRPGLLPTFAPSGSFRPPVLAIYLRHLAEAGFQVPPHAFEAGVRRYNGDRVAGGRGEVLVATRPGRGG